MDTPTRVPSAPLEASSAGPAAGPGSTPALDPASHGAATRPRFTLAGSVSARGVGLHSGREVTIAFHPAPIHAGIVWRRVDLPGKPAIAAGGATGATYLVEHVTRTERATTLEANGACVQTVEHVMAALAGLGVDDAYVEVDGPEAPLLDGSALEFGRLLSRAGLREQGVQSPWPRLTRPVYVQEGDALLVALPASGFTLHYTFTSDHPALGCQFAQFSIGAGESPHAFGPRFLQEIAPARTVGWLHEVEALRRRGLALGASLDSAVVVDEERLLTPLRLPHEVARHKVLDLMGDLFLVGPFQARVVALRSGHRHHVALARALAAPGVLAPC